MLSQVRSIPTDASELERIHLITAFVMVGELLSFAKAARIISVAPSTLSRKVAKLEDLLSTRLFERTTRRVAFTELGELYFWHYREILTQLREADETIAAYHFEPQGWLRVSFPVAFGHLELSSIIADFISVYPRVKIEVNYTDRFVDMVEEGYHAVVRIGSLPDSSLVARKIGTNRKLLVATPAYLASHGVPTVPADLAKHNCLCFSHYPKSGSTWQMKRGEEIEIVKVSGVFRSDSSEAIYEAALRGIGIAIIAEYICADAIERGRLVPILEDWVIWPETSFYICYASNKHLLPKTRALSDFLVQRLRNRLR